MSDQLQGGSSEVTPWPGTPSRFRGIVAVGTVGEPAGTLARLERYRTVIRPGRGSDITFPLSSRLTVHGGVGALPRSAMWPRPARFFAVSDELRTRSPVDRQHRMILCRCVDSDLRALLYG